jgi:carbon-monoxide dehydrogenase medium subunit
VYDFEYLRAKSVGEAVDAVAAADDARFLAGGMTLIPTLRQRLAQPSLLVDISRVEELHALQVIGSSLTIGAMTLHATVAESPQVRRTLPALGLLAAQIGDPQVRNRGSLGGSIANNDPAADYPAAALGLGATIVTDRRRVAADDFFVGMFETLLEPDELVVALEFPIPERAGYAKLRQPASRYALAGVLVARLQAGVRVAVTGASPCVFRHLAMEQALEENFAPESLDRIVTNDGPLISDIHGSASYRAEMIRVLAQRAVAAAV